MLILKIQCISQIFRCLCLKFTRMPRGSFGLLAQERNQNGICSGNSQYHEGTNLFQQRSAGKYFEQLRQ